MSTPNCPSIGVIAKTSARAVVVRNLLRPVDFLPFGYVVGTSYAASGDGRRVGDVFADTRVVVVREDEDT